MSTGTDAQNFALFLISLLEDCAIQNAKMQAFILSLPEAKEPGFSIARLLAETGRAEDTVRGLLQRYAEVRGMLLEFPPREAEAKEALRQDDGTNQKN
jgi:hypothetical protein